MGDEKQKTKVNTKEYVRKYEYRRGGMKLKNFCVTEDICNPSYRVEYSTLGKWNTGALAHQH
jgi:hypothetical protein